MLKYISALIVCAGLLANHCYAADFLTGQAARAVIGQSTFNSQVTGGSATVLGAIGGVAYAANTLFVADANRLGLLPNNNRLLIFNNIQQMFPAPDAEIPDNSGRCPVCGGTASVVVGQPDFSTVAQVTPPTRSSLRLPTAVASAGNTCRLARSKRRMWKSGN